MPKVETTDADKSEVKALLAKARKEPLNFGLGLGTKPDEVLLMMSRTKEPAALAREAKAGAKAPKSAAGTLSLQDKKLTLRFAARPPAGTAKLLALYLKKVIGLTLTVIVADAAGETLESEDDDAPAQAGPAQTGPQAVAPLTGAGQPAPQGGAEREGTSPDPADTEPADAGPPDAGVSAPADTPAQASEPASPEPASPPPTAKGAFDSALKQVMPQVQSVVAANPTAKEGLLKMIQSVRQAAEAEDAATAKRRLDQLVEVLGKLAASLGGGKDGGNGAPRLSLVRLGKARIEWQAIREGAITGLGRLKTAVERDYADMPEAAQAVTSALRQLDQRIARLNAELQDQLDRVLNAQGPAREAEAETARALVRDFLRFVEADAVMAALDGNEFLPDLAVTAPVKGKLAEIVAALG